MRFLKARGKHMVVLKEISGDMFWGLTITTGKHYSQTVDRAFQVSMAALECDPKGKCDIVQVMYKQESFEFLLCTLGPGVALQQPLDLEFSCGETVCFFLRGEGVVHLTGVLTSKDDFEDDYPEDAYDSESDAPVLVSADDSDDSDDENWLPETHGIGAKRKALAISGLEKKKRKIADEDDEEEDDDDEYDSSFIDDETIEGEEEEEGSDEDGDMEESLPTPSKQTSSEASSPSKKKKKDKSSKTKENNVERQPGKTASPVGNATNGETAKKKKKKKKKKKIKQETAENNEQSQAETTPAQPGTPKSSPAVGKKRTVAGGTSVEDTKVGHGPEVKPGSMVSVYYSGMLAKNNKRFDSCLKGKPFRFRLGRGEVIKGWDTGLIGMKVGGKRRITVPSSQGYGNSRQGPIPPGSTLIFDVEMKAVS